jgi:hypothetical protein
MKAYRSRGIAPLILNLGVRWRCMVHFTLPSFYPREIPRCPMNRRLGLDVLEKRKISYLYRDWNPGPSSP